MMSRLRRIFKVLLWTVVVSFGLILLAAVTVQVVFSAKVCTSLVERYAPRFIDGKLSMSSISVSFFRNFPAVSFNVDSLLLVYPAERFDTSECKGVEDFLAKSGTFGFRPFAPHSDSLTCDDGIVKMDTLAMFSNFKVAVNVLPLLDGVLNIKKVSLTHPRLFIHRYADGTSNLDIIKLKLSDQSDEEESKTDSSSFVLKEIILRGLRIGDHAAIVYSDQKDTLDATLWLDEMEFKGKLSSHEPDKCNFNLNLDTLFVSGRVKRDTVFFNMDHLGLDAKPGSMNINATARAFAATHAFGRMKIPLAADGLVEYDFRASDGIHLGLRKFGVDVATVHADTDMDVTFGDSIAMKGQLSIPALDIQRLSDEYFSHYISLAKEIRTDAVFSLGIDVDGYYDKRSGTLPKFKAVVDLPSSFIQYEKNDMSSRLELHASAGAEQGGKLLANVEKLNIAADGVGVKLSGTASDVLGKDPLFDVKASVRMSLDTLNYYLSDFVKMNASGKVDADISGHFLLSQLNLYKFKDADVRANLLARNVALSSYDDSLHIYCDSLGARMGLMEQQFGKTRKFKMKTLGGGVRIDSVFVENKGMAHLSGKNLRLVVQSSPDQVKLNDTLAYNPVFASLFIGSAFLEGADSVSLKMKDSRNTIFIHPSRKNIKVPVINVMSKNERIRLKAGPNRLMLSGLDFEAKAQMNGDERKKRFEAYRDSMYRAHPDWSKDSLRNYMRRRVGRSGTPHWLTEDDLKQGDIQLDLGSSFKKYYLQWSVNGDLHLKKAYIATPAFPLRTAIRGFHGSFDNDRVAIDSLRIVSGTSNLEMRGALTNLRRAILRRGVIRLDAGIQTTSMDLSELLYSYGLGRQNIESANMSRLSDSIEDDNQYLNQVAVDSVDVYDSTVNKLIIVPKNLEANLTMRGTSVTYSSLCVDSLKADILIKDRCAQITNTQAKTAVGDVELDAFYATRSKQDLLTGFDLKMSNISAGDVIALLPSVDSLMPLLKSFDGKLNLDMAATASLDTTMNILMPTVNGVMRISGSNLHFNDNPQVTQIAKLMLIKNPEHAAIDTMTVEAIVKDNQCEIFPFLLKIDKWTLAIAGVQNLDESFQYHVSLTKSPILLKLGLNIYGDDFDDIKFKLGKAKFKNTDIPSFSTVIDETKVNLVNSIRNIFDRGVERAVKEHNMYQDEAIRKGESIKKENAVSLETIEELSPNEKARLDALERNNSGK